MKTRDYGEAPITGGNPPGSSIVHQKTPMELAYQKAEKNYRLNRENGDERDLPTADFPGDGKRSYRRWKAGTNIFIARYTSGAKDKIWMAEKDEKHVFRLEREGQLDAVEPNLRTEVPELYKEIVGYRNKKRAENKKTEKQIKQLPQTEIKKQPTRTNYLLRAINADDFCEVKRLLELGHDIEGVNLSGWTALFIASYRDHLDIVEYLLDEGANIEAKDKGERTPLYVASDCGNTKMVRCLLENGANAMATLKNGQDALSIAKNKGHKLIVSLLERHFERYPSGIRPGIAFAKKTNKPQSQHTSESQATFFKAPEKKKSESINTNQKDKKDEQNKEKAYCMEYQLALLGY